MACILIIDGSPVNVALLERLSLKLDHSIQSFTDPIKGFSWAIENEFDLLLVDYHMPGLDGLTFIKKLRAVPEKATVPILMISSENSSLLQPALEAGANDFLQKPLNKTEFWARAKNMLKLRDNETALIKYAENLEREVEKATQRLKLTHERYRLAALASSDGFWDWDLKKETIYYSNRWFEMMGYRPSELPHTLETWFSRVHKDDLCVLQKQLDQLMSGTLDMLDTEVRVYNRNREILWTSVKSLTEKDQDGKIRRLVGAQTDISERKRVEERLARDALHDSLTGLPNRMLFNELFHQAFSRYKRDPKENFALLFLDIDHFKKINDTLGHAVGDEVLIAFAERMRTCCREVDTVARLAGDEFVILLSAPNELSHTRQIAERLVSELSRPVALNEQEIHPSVSIGIAFSDPSYQAPPDMLQDADLALYQAKEKGRNQFALFDVTNKKETPKALRHKSDLARALKEEEFTVYFQGIFDTETKTLLGFEALARWQHPDLGLVMPKDFLLFAEETGNIAGIDRQIFEESIRQMAAWRQQSGRDLFISFNLSVSALMNFSLKTDLLKLTQEHGLDPQNVVLELPEKIAQDGLKVADKMLTSLKDLGFRIALDDFGATAVSLHTLPTLPLDILKIDRSLITNIHTHYNNQEILRLLKLIVQDLNLDLILEGVETKDELDFVKKNFKGMIQGFYFQKPLPASEIEALYPDLSPVPLQIKA